MSNTNLKFIMGKGKSIDQIISDIYTKPFDKGKTIYN